MPKGVSVLHQQRLMHCCVEQQVDDEVGQSARLHIKVSCACRAGADLASNFNRPMHKPDVERF